MAPYSVFAALLGFCALVLLSSQSGEAFVVIIAPRTMECVYENAKPGQFISLQFQVLEGGKQDVDIKVLQLDFLSQSLYSDLTSYSVTVLLYLVHLQGEGLSQRGG
jgi:hypothetical protein